MINSSALSAEFEFRPIRKKIEMAIEFEIYLVVPLTFQAGN